MVQHAHLEGLVHTVFANMQQAGPAHSQCRTCVAAHTHFTWSRYESMPPLPCSSSIAFGPASYMNELPSLPLCFRCIRYLHSRWVPQSHVCIKSAISDLLEQGVSVFSKHTVLLSGMPRRGLGGLCSAMTIEQHGAASDNACLRLA